MVLPEIDAGIEGCDEKEGAFRCADYAVSLWGDLDLFVVLVVHLYDCVFDSFFE